MVERLSPLDASFLLLERLWLPMHFSGLSLLDPSSRPQGPLTETELHAIAARRLRRLPQLSRRVEFPFHGLGHPVWTAAVPDLQHHLSRHELPDPGDRQELLQLVGRIHAEPLDRGRPLWELHLIDGLEDGRQALLMKVHHSIADGLGGMDIAAALYDRGPRRPVRPGPQRPPVPAWLAALQVGMGAAQFVADGLLAPKSLFNGPVGPRRELALAAISSKTLLAAKRRFGLTLDDVLLEIVASGVKSYFVLQGLPVPASLRVMVPASTREGAGEAGNHVSAMFFDLPRGAAGAAAEQAKARLRRAHEAFSLGALVDAAGRLPGPLHTLVVRAATARPTANLVVSDIPGPAAPFTLHGVRVDAMYPVMPLAPGTALSVAAISMGGVVGIGFTVDPLHVPHPERMAAAVEAAATRLLRPGPPRAVARRGRRSAPRSAPARRAASA